MTMVRYYPKPYTQDWHTRKTALFALVWTCREYDVRAYCTKTRSTLIGPQSRLLRRRDEVRMRVCIQ